MKVRVPISERIASKMVKENENNLVGHIVETRTVFKNGETPIFEIVKQVKEEGEVVSYFGYLDEYKQEM